MRDEGDEGNHSIEIQEDPLDEIPGRPTLNSSRQSGGPSQANSSHSL